MNLTIEEAAKATGGRLCNVLPQTAVAKISTDTREDVRGGLFIALKGENFDGHDHMAQAVENGAAAVLTERDAGGLPAVKVTSTHRALLDLAAYYRKKHSAKVVAVTGSAGKTTTKDMIAFVLAQQFSVLKTPGNKNNLIGMPLTLLSLNDSHQAAVIEMGMNHFGEIHDLSLAAAPDAAVITNIGDAHIEYLGSREGILKAKLEITDGLVPGGKLILNGGDMLLNGLRERFPAADYVSINQVSHIDLHGLDGTECVFNIGGESVPVLIPVPGAHMITNALLAAAVGTHMGLTPGQIADGIRAFVPSGRRMQLHDAGGMRVIDDAYNANPSSVKAAVQTLADMNGTARKVCVLGDMLELGSHAERLHKEVGEYARNSSIDLLIAVGESAAFYGADYYFKNNGDFIKAWRNLLRPGDTVLFKASLGMDFKAIIREVTTV